MSLLTFERLDAPFGAVATGFDSSGRVSDDEAAEFRRQLDEHQLLLLRGTRMDADVQIRLVGIFGQLCDERGTGRLHTVVSNVEPDTFLQTRLLFHQDHAWSPFPPQVLSLYAETLEGAIIPTFFASNVRAHQSLSASQRTRFADLKAAHAMRRPQPGVDVHSYEMHRIRLDPASEADLKTYPRTVQPLICAHPRTHRPMLYATELFTSHILDCSPEDSESVIQEVYEVLYEPSNIYVHEWLVGDLVIWDNLALQHARAATRPESRRTLRRVVISSKSMADVNAFADGTDAWSLESPSTTS